jgi:tRNA A37 methylthiotransferase MiaB
MPGQVDEAVKAERLERLNALLDEQQKAFNAAQVGKTMPVLFEKKWPPCRARSSAAVPICRPSTPKARNI